MTGPAKLDGTLDINLVNGFGPSAGQNSRSSRSPRLGSFATVNGLAQNNRTILQPVLNPAT